jgi:hypothetical protein
MTMVVADARRPDEIVVIMVGAGGRPVVSGKAAFCKTATPCVMLPRGHQSRDEGHGQRSDAQQQGKEEAKG